MELNFIKVKIKLNKAFIFKNEIFWDQCITIQM